ncbi:MAG: type 11 methyltransferase [Marinimicrobia bacterium 46_43]|nr:MAG: type 11 methyltransferase [Marinimicrobia bacterium 46_43]
MCGYNQLNDNHKNNETQIGIHMNDKKKTLQQQYIKEKYGLIARNSGSCCDFSPSPCCSSSNETPIELSIKIGYSPQEISDVPEGANLNLGCGNPQMLASLKLGEVVLDLGSGAGFDSFLAARQVGLRGKVLGIDMTAEMVKKARENAVKGAYLNTFFQLGQIERIPLRDNCIDVIISNCVINLSTDKTRVFREAYRVLKPGGRLAISDTIALTELPEEIKNDLDLYSACFAGAMEYKKLEHLLEAIGFSNIRVDFAEKGFDITRNWSLSHNLKDYIRSAAISANKIL